MEQLKLKEAFDFSGKKVLITGGARDLGYEMATGFAELGADLFITSRNFAGAQKTAETLEKDFGVNVTPFELDVSDEKSVGSLFEKIFSEHSKIDVLVNNAGGHSKLSTGKLETEPLEAWKQYVDINLTGTFLMMQGYIKNMMPLNEGIIINIASISAVTGRDRNIYTEDMTPQPVAYAATKAGVLGLTRDAAAYLGPHGIRVNVISPGGFERGQNPEFVEKYSDLTMLGRMGRDRFDLKGTAVFLASDAANYITGQNILVDGGFTVFK